jgi:hypothetical protein
MGGQERAGVATHTWAVDTINLKLKSGGGESDLA